MGENVSSIRFGTDGWRGVIADDFTYDNLRKVSHATASYIKTHTELGNGSVLIAYDRRFLSREFAEESAKVIARHGVPIKIATQTLPTPAVSFCVVHRKASWGIMITASHNPALYNGFKIKDGHGRSAPPEVTREIEAHLNLSMSSPAVTGRGSMDSPPTTAGNDGIATFDDRAAYEHYLKSRLDWKVLRRFKATVVFDHLYGTASGIPERVLASTSVKINSLHATHDPLFGGLHPEPIESQLGDLMKEVRRRKAAVGIALDGDADRLGVVDEQGRYLTPHQVFPLLVLHCIEHKGWKGKVVQAVSLGYLSERIAREFNLPFEEVPVGFKYVAERMLQNNFLAGGEESGGYAVRGGLPERDGILNGLLFLEMLAARKKSPSQLLKEMEKRFGAARFKRIDIHLDHPILDRTHFAREISSRIPDRLAGEKVSEVRTRDGVKVILQSGSWVLLRPSGTEPLIRTYAESDTVSRTDKLLHWAKKMVTS
jgi:phosphomannomutase